MSEEDDMLVNIPEEVILRYRIHEHCTLPVPYISRKDYARETGVLKNDLQAAEKKIQQLEQQLEEANKKLEKYEPDRNFYHCPVCRYAISKLEKDLAVIDFPCPKCRKHKFSDFIKLKEGE